MNRQFKLIKQYPDCYLELGTSITFEESVEEVKLTPKNQDFDYFYSLSECIKYSEFWEEVINSAINLYGDTFTIGDKVSYKLNLWPDNCFITKFRTLDNKNIDVLVQQKVDCAWYNINDLIPYPKLIHTTEDGFKIYKLNHPKIWWVHLKTFNIGIDYENTLSNIDTINYKYFSTEKGAKHYIYLNKPEYSIQDIKNAIQTQCGQWTITTEDDLVLIDLGKLCK